MNITLNHTNTTHFNSELTITGSKSESNRLLILQQLFNNLQIKNLSNSKDTQVLQKALNSKNSVVNIGHAGTAMRFLTAYLSSIKGIDLTLTGSKRMHQRPIKILVDALISIGADITYLENEGFPPLRIKGKQLNKSNVSIKGNVSSQYISALLLIAPSLPNGLKINLIDEVTSIPYIKMTLSLLNKIGMMTEWKDNVIKIYPKKSIEDKTITVESDWSSASYFYSLVALAKKSKIELSYFNKKSLQGDKALAELYLNFGVKTTFKKQTIILEKTKNFKSKKHIKLDLVNTPDIAQTIAVTCFGLNVSCELIGLHTLKIKETDRLKALKTELQKFGAKIKITNDSFYMDNEQRLNTKDQRLNTIKTYDDHRMAMAFAPLSLLYPLIIKDAEVVEKSFPSFWSDLDKIFK